MTGLRAQEGSLGCRRQQDDLPSDLGWSQLAAPHQGGARVSSSSIVRAHDAPLSPGMRATAVSTRAALGLCKWQKIYCFQVKIYPFRGCLNFCFCTKPLSPVSGRTGYPSEHQPTAAMDPVTKTKNATKGGKKQPWPSLEREPRLQRSTGKLGTLSLLTKRGPRDSFLLPTRLLQRKGSHTTNGLQAHEQNACDPFKRQTHTPHRNCHLRMPSLPF